MLTKNKNPKVSYYSRLLVLPLAAIVFFAFTFKVKTVNDAAPKSSLHNVSKSTSVLKIMYDTIPKSKKKTQVHVISINGIDKISKKEDTKVVVMKEGESVPPPLIMALEGYNSIPANALLIANGKEISNKEMKNIPANNIQSINVLKGESAVKKYGDKGKDGVVEIITKDSKTLIIIDGKEAKKDEYKKIQPYNMKSIILLKREDAIKKYGNKADDGVIEITTKNNNIAE